MADFTAGLQGAIDLPVIFEDDGITGREGVLITAFSIRLWDGTGELVYARDQGDSSPSVYDMDLLIFEFAELGSGVYQLRLTFTEAAVGALGSIVVHSTLYGFPATQYSIHVSTSAEAAPTPATTSTGASARSTLRASLRTRIRDEDTPYTFTDAEINEYLENAIKAYSREISRETGVSIAFVAGQYEGYSLPRDCREVISLKVGTTVYTVTEIFGGLFSISPTPSASATATMKYRTCHAIPAADDEASSYDPIDEPLILLHAQAQCWETLAGDAAKYYQYREGDIEEDQGKTQKYYRDEADRLFLEFAEGAAKSRETLSARRPVTTTPMIAGVVSREAPSRETTIYKEYD